MGVLLKAVFSAENGSRETGSSAIESPIIVSLPPKSRNRRVRGVSRDLSSPEKVCRLAFPSRPPIIFYASVSAILVLRSSDRHDTRGGDRLGLQWNITDIASERLAAGRFDYQRRPIIRLSGEARHRSLGYKNLSINCVYKVV